MKIYISADIGGIIGILNWDQCHRGTPEYNFFKDQMSKEVAAACIGANNAGANEILIKVGHSGCYNLDFNVLPENAVMICGSSGHPFSMMQEIDSSFDAAIMIGYHSGASFGDNPLSHTYSLDLSSFKINGDLANEYLINSYTASYVGVPVVFLSGDAGICKFAQNTNPNITTVVTNKHFGRSTIANHPELSLRLIRDGVTASLLGEVTNCFLELPESFNIELTFHDPATAYRKSFYPGMEKISQASLSFFSKDYYEVLRMIQFCLY
ncbi:MAG: M55 family metallopeptidase [Oscillospiraceae bacterium]|nr:M55 family metallopeptidase [Oscillospiraceae bacterium]